MNTQSVVDQMSATLAQRRQMTRDRRSAFLALACAILSDSSIDQRLSSLTDQSSPIVRYAA